MEKLFGIPMQSIMYVLLALLGLCLLSVAFVAWRRPVIFKLGVRNIPRRKAQTTLIILGLMLATLIMAASLGTGDTLNQSVKQSALDTLGPVDEIVVYNENPDQDPNLGSAFVFTIPQESVQAVSDAVSGNDNVDGVAGVLMSRAPFINIGETDPATISASSDFSSVGIASEPMVTIAGLNQESIDAIGGEKTTDGKDVDVSTLGETGIYINQKAASKLDAKTGQNLVFYINNTQYIVTVVGILPDTILSGSTGEGNPGVLMDLGRLQQISGNEGKISAVVVSNKGGTESGLDRSEEVTEFLEPKIEGNSLGVIEIKSDLVEQAEMIGSIFVAFFIIFGLFSIGVGILLIVLIFTMLAAERRAEMGMERAVGAQRRQLIQQFLAEGAGYTLLSGIVGTTLGVAATFAIAKGFQSAFGDDFGITAYVSPRSMIVAYCLGVVITFLTVALSSWRVSRLNIVAAVRDIPDAYTAHRNRRQLIWSIVMIVAGSLLLLSGYSSEKLWSFSIGITIIPFGVAGILTYFGAKPRLILSLAGLLTLVYWLLPADISEQIFGKMSGDLEMFFVSGICIVAASTLVIVQNLDAILAVVERLGGSIRGMLASTRLAVSYPGASKGRTGMTIAMFSLIVFSLVMIAAINANFTAAFLNDDAFAGYNVSLEIPKENPVDDLNATLSNSGVDTTQIEDFGRLDLAGQASFNYQNKEGDWMANQFASGDQAFYDGGNLTFQARANGYDSDEAIIQALLTEPNVVVVPPSMAENGVGGFGEATGVTGIKDKGSFDAVTLPVRTGDGADHQVKVIGVLDAKYSYFFYTYSGQPTFDSLYPNLGTHDVVYYMHAADGVSAKDLANTLEVKMLQYGAVGTDLKQQMKDDQSTQQSFMWVLQGFMGLGLIVGIAAVGVIAFRAVVERRQQIGMMRALGFQRGMIQSAFVVESGIIVLLGVLAGAVFGLLLAYQLMTSEDFTEGAPSSTGFIVPWVTIIATLLLSIIAALVMSWLPARQASRVVPAEALRYE